ncbi:putative regulator of chromosome condensation protein [Thermochaetoides thermophila DSM 1495]|uniref:Putative regulator of chromosome condensation protein n=1 Tax=Chaetomium thermophilum (strain DSM 1495 / CBS 144.50 / IMI 039719) TaxID=759272 RepID=G0S954_CHATD|nr:putative regulator of chromosome condensation protein [Thermochaetoides thermophila DSM 1495]EGS19965.1 putative regulator of chromosome condensation protein [Thermochaetoides thermophila DSM 1495]
MPPKRAAATRAVSAAADAKAAMATSSKKSVTKNASTNGTTGKVTKPAGTKVTKSVAAKKAVAAAEIATSRKKAATKGDESDKENKAKKAAVNGVKRKRDVDEEQVNGVDEETKTGRRAAKRAKSQPAEEAATMQNDKEVDSTNKEDETTDDTNIAAKSASAIRKRKADEPATKPAMKRPARELKVINEPPTQVMDVFVFGEGTAGELGLGSVRYDGKKPIDVKRPRINHNLKNVVQIACGGMHVAALTKDNKILTWGVNDQGALGRDTTWDGGLRDINEEDSDDDDNDDTGMNPKESTPGEIDTTDIPEGTRWVQVVASDSATFALTDTGLVYGWGTFRSNEGILGFSKNVLVQRTPTLVPGLSKIKKLAAGLNHILAMDEKNKIYAWGAGQQAQLARRLLERDEGSTGLQPTGIGSLPHRAKPDMIACGSYHSFVIDTKKRVYGWGLNNYAELGIEDGVGQEGSYLMRPQLIEALAGYKIVDIAGGEHHSLACTEDGKLLTWGRIDGHQVGQPSESFSEDNTVWDERQKPRILIFPTVVPNIEGVVKVAAGTDHSFAVTKDGKVYSWGFSANYQTGQGTTDDIEAPTLIDNSAIRDRKIIFAGAGGQYGILGALPLEDQGEN